MLTKEYLSNLLEMKLSNTGHNAMKRHNIN